MILFGYIDPSAGLQIVSQAGPMFGFLLALLGAVLWPFRFVFGLLWQSFKKKPKYFLAVLVLLSVSGTAIAYYSLNNQVERGGDIKKIMILGMDGLDPNIMEKMMQEGELPHFRALKERGSYARLGTVTPPQSPVAWSTFATGLNPGGHGMYDFLRRHTENYMPDLALSDLKPAKSFKIFGKEISWGKPHFENRRNGTPMWTLTSEAGIPSTVMHCPVTFPPDKVTGVMLAGMGVPDIRGTPGTFGYYTNRQLSGKSQGGKQIPVYIKNGMIETVLKGPRGQDGKDIEVDLKIEIVSDNRGIQLHLPGQAEHLGLEEWSPWVRVEFPVGGMSKVSGMTRFYLKSLSPFFELYASPFNFTPESPVHPISYPDDYAKRLQASIGDFHTLGMPHDTWAVNEGAMTEDMFLAQSQTILKEEKAMLRHELPRFKEGLFIFVVETPDRIQHMFWRAVDKENALYTEEFASKYGGVIPDAYKDMDEILGLVMEHLDEKTVLMVVSDHGFKSFRRAVHLNSWLRDNGYLVFRPGLREREGKEFFQGVDWSRSKAYAVGLGSVYLNLKGREKQGIVEPGREADELKREVAEKMKTIRDEKAGERIVRNVYLAESIYEGEKISEAPDLLVGFEDGYRASWQTALGASPIPVVEDNLKKWSGGHILDHTLVPGIFFSNQKITKKNPTLYDFSPTVLSLFGLEIPAEQKGRNLFEVAHQTVP